MAFHPPPARVGRPVIRLGAALSLAFALMMLYIPYQFQGAGHRYLYDWLLPLGAVFLGATVLQALTLAQLGLGRWLSGLGHLLFAAGMLAMVATYYRSQGLAGAIGYLLLLMAYLLAVAFPRQESAVFRMLYGVLLLMTGGPLVAVRLAHAASPAAHLPVWLGPLFLIPGMLVWAIPWLKRRWPWTEWVVIAATAMPIAWVVQGNIPLHNWFSVAVNGALLVGALTQAQYLRRPWLVTSPGLRRQMLALTLTIAVVPTIGLGAYSVYNVQRDAHARALEALRDTADDLNRRLDRFLAGQADAPLSQEALTEHLQDSLPSRQLKVALVAWPGDLPSSAIISEVREETPSAGDRRLVARVGRPDLRIILTVTQEATVAYTKAARHAASLLLGTMAVAGLALAAGTVLSSRLTRRLAMLREAITAVGQQQFDVGTILQSQDGDEVDLVSATLREMAARLQDETARRESEHRRLSTVLRVLPVGVFLADHSGQLYHVNAAGRKMWGIDDAPLVGPDQWRVYPARDPATGRLLALEERAMYRAMRGEERPQLEVMIDAFDGQRKAFLQSAIPVRDELGAITDVVGTLVDITHQKEQEAALRDSQALLEGKRDILEMVAVGAPLADVLSAIARFAERRVGGGLCEIFLVDESGRHIRLAAAPSLPAGFFAPAEQMSVSPDVCVSGPAVVRKETVICEDIASDPAWKEHRDVVMAHGIRSAWSMPILTAHGEALGTITIFEREPGRPSEEQLRAVATATHMAAIAIERERVEQGRGQKLQSLLQHMAEGVIAVDQQRRLLLINPAARRLLGLPETQDPDCPWADVLPDEVAATLDRTAGPGAYQPEKIRFSSNGRDLEADLSPVYSDFGRFGAIAVIRDITEQIKFRRLQESFVANVSHELRGPLASISATLEAIVDGVIPADARPRYYRAMLDEMARLRRLSFEVIDLTRLDSGVAQLRSEPVAVDKLLEAVVDRVSHRAAEAGIRLRVSCAPVQAMGDPDRVDQVIANLVDNAIRYTPPGGEIHLVAVPEGSVVRIAVSDTGVGIPAEHLPFIFERFYKVDAARTPKQGAGTGLGLAIARQLVERMGGTMHVASTEGQGTTFTFTLPALPGGMD